MERINRANCPRLFFRSPVQGSVQFEKLYGGHHRFLQGFQYIVGTRPARINPIHCDIIVEGNYSRCLFSVRTRVICRRELRNVEYSVGGKISAWSNGESDVLCNGGLLRFQEEMASEISDCDRPGTF